MFHDLFKAKNIHYKIIFRWPIYSGVNTQEYRKILRLHDKQKVRDTFYSEILDLVSSYEFGFGKLLVATFEKIGRKLYPAEVDQLFTEFEAQHHWTPLVSKARQKMASRDLAFRDALHHQLKEYVTPVERDKFERFLGNKSMELAERLEDAKEVMKRLKERG